MSLVACTPRDESTRRRRNLFFSSAFVLWLFDMYVHVPVSFIPNFRLHFLFVTLGVSSSGRWCWSLPSR